MIEYKKITPILFLATVVCTVVTLTLFGAHFIENSTNAQTFIAKLGHLGVIIIATIAGLNVIIPIPAATLTPIFTAAGLWLPLIILSLTLGTLAANFIGYQLGTWSRTHVYKTYPRVVIYLENIYTRHPRLIIPLIF